MAIKITDGQKEHKICRFKNLDEGAVFSVIDDNLSEMEGRGYIFMKVCSGEHGEFIGCDFNAVILTEGFGFELRTIKENALVEEFDAELRIDDNPESYY